MMTKIFKQVQPTQKMQVAVETVIKPQFPRLCGMPLWYPPASLPVDEVFLSAVTDSLIPVKGCFPDCLNASSLISWRKGVTYISPRKWNTSPLQLTWISRTEHCLAPEIQLLHLLTLLLWGCFDWKEWEFGRRSSSDWFFFKAVGEGKQKAWHPLQTKISMG